MPRNQDPVRKIVTKSGEVKYRFVIDMGKRPDGGRDQRCFTYTKYQEARAARAKIIAARQSKTLIKPAKTPLTSLPSSGSIPVTMFVRSPDSDTNTS